MTAPLRNATNDVMDRATDISGAPAAANARKTTLPVMFAVKTWPSPRKLTASIVPLTAVSTRSAIERRSMRTARLAVGIAPASIATLLGVVSHDLEIIAASTASTAGHLRAGH